VVGSLLADLEDRGTDDPVDLVAGYAFHCCFTVISELLDIPEPDHAALGTWTGSLLTPHRRPAAPAAAVEAAQMVAEYLTRCSTASAPRSATT
jgi:cytochrome P450